MLEVVGARPPEVTNTAASAIAGAASKAFARWLRLSWRMETPKVAINAWQSLAYSPLGVVGPPPPNTYYTFQLLITSVPNSPAP